MRKFLSNLVLALGIVLSFGVFASLAKKLYWAFDLLTHFYLQYAVLLLGAFLFVLVVAKGREKARALLVIPALAIVLVNLAPFFTKTSLPIQQNQVQQNAKSTKAIALNVYFRNPNALSIATYLKQEDADLVLLTEITSETMQVLKNELGSLYPYIQDSSRRGAFGIALLSKQPLDIAQTINFRTNSRRAGQSIYAVVDGLHIVGVHPLPPTAGRFAALRDNELAGMHSFIEELLTNDVNGPILLLGDFNASPWSYPLVKLFSETSMTHGAYGHGIWPTWRLYGKGPIIFGAPIDHILVSENINTLSYTTKLIEGSDHSAVIGEFAVP